MANTPLAGSGGRIRYASNVTLAFVTDWKIMKALDALPYLNFESTQDSNGVIWVPKISSNVADGKGSLAGWYDAGTLLTESVLVMGSTVSIDFLLNKTTSLGYHNVSCIIGHFETGNKIKDKEVVPFTCEFEVDGVVPPIPTTS